MTCRRKMECPFTKQQSCVVFQCRLYTKELCDPYKSGSNPLMSNTEEAAFVAYVKEVAAAGHGYTRGEMANLAGETFGITPPHFQHRWDGCFNWAHSTPRKNSICGTITEVSNNVLRGTSATVQPLGGLAWRFVQTIEYALKAIASSEESLQGRWNWITDV